MYGAISNILHSVRNSSSGNNNKSLKSGYANKVNIALLCQGIGAPTANIPHLSEKKILWPPLKFLP